jgi:hypothetical protein
MSPTMSMLRGVSVLSVEGEGRMGGEKRWRDRSGEKQRGQTSVSG